MAKKNSKKGINEKAVKKHDNTEIHGLIVFSMALVLVLSLISFSLYDPSSSSNWLGAVGHTFAWGFTAIFGLGSYLFCLFLGWAGWRLMFKKPLNHLPFKVFFAFIGIVSACMLLSLFEERYPASANSIIHLLYQNAVKNKMRYHLGGAPFFYLYRDLPGFNLLYIFNALGVAIIFTCTLIISLLFLAKVSLFSLASKIPQAFHKFKLFTSTAVETLSSSTDEKSVAKPIEPVAKEKENNSDFLRYVKLRIPTSGGGQGPSSSEQVQHPTGEMLAIQPEINLKSRPSLSRKEQFEKPKELPEKTFDIKIPEKAHLPADTTPQKPKREAALAAQRVHNGDFSAYQLPSLSLLTNAKKTDHTSLKKDLRRKAEVLEETLLSFGIEAKVGQINCGPTITSFEVHPAIGVKVQKIKTLENDIALNMEAKSIRIIAPIPGKAVVGIEVPNAQPEEVGFKEMLAAYQQAGRKFHIPILLGKAVNGDYVMSDLTKMPHCIIAGATGSGKSVCINTIVMSILLNAKPDEIKLVMVDPKKVELTPYTRLPHMLAPVITEPQGACSALNWLVKEMEKRYDLLKQIGARNIEAFNNRTVDKDFEASLGLEIPARLHYIVGIVDELADLMMVSSSDIETPIARIAQMARAVGIHLILATQRPSREVITGLIKANFPTRISFKVSSRINSQIVLDETGAETLLGNGDMLFLPPGASHLVRAQGAFIRDEDINAVVKSICDQAPPRYVIESFDTLGQLDPSEFGVDDEPADALYSQALDVVLGTGNASTTFLQRKLKIGYARAASLIDMLEQKGIVGPAEGSKPRKIMVARQGAKEDEEPPEEMG